MENEQPNWVPKMHPLDRLSAPEDPMELMADSVPGDPSVMLDCVLQEFAWLGCSQEELLSLFYHPGYPVLVQLREHFGDEAVKARVAAIASRWGRLRFTETISEDEDSPMDDVELVQLSPIFGLPANASPAPTDDA